MFPPTCAVRTSIHVPGFLCHVDDVAASRVATLRSVDGDVVFRLTLLSIITPGWLPCTQSLHTSLQVSVMPEHFLSVLFHFGSCSIKQSYCLIHSLVPLRPLVAIVPLLTPAAGETLRHAPTESTGPAPPTATLPMFYGSAMPALMPGFYPSIHAL